MGSKNMSPSVAKRSDVIPGVMSAIVEHGGVLYMAGITGEGDDIATQTAHILSKADALLAEHGSCKHRLLSATLYITDLSLRPAANKVWTAWLPEGDEPARTSAAASALMPGELIEIVFTAATADSGPIRRHGRNPGTYHAVVEHAGLLHFAGCSMHDADDDMAAQTKGALARLQDRLEECGCGLDDILSLTCFVYDIGQLPAMNNVYSQWKGDTLVPPARAVLATDLGGQDVKFTVTCIAATKDYPVEHLGTAVPFIHNHQYMMRYISGMVGTVDADGNTLDNEDDMGDQTTNALARVGQVLAEHGASPHSIITSTLYVTDMAKKPAMNEAWAQWFKPHAVPARATIEIDSLGAKRLIEVCAVAAIVSSSKL